VNSASILLGSGETADPHPRVSAAALVVTAVALLGITLAAFVLTPLADMPVYFGGGYFVLDATSMLFLLVINSVFLGISVYVASRVKTSRMLADNIVPRALLTVAFMVAMNVGTLSNHLVLLWCLIELTTLCAAPLVAQGHALQPRRVAWHYMLYSSMSLALTFLGIMCLTRAAGDPQGTVHFFFDAMAAALGQNSTGWQQLGLALMLFGLGSKLGLAPLYSWLPETYEAAPTSTSALLAAVQFNISVVAVFRVLQVFRGLDTGFVRHELLVMGCLTLCIAAVQIMAAKNYKRLLAYACVSSSGVIAIGLSVGRAAAYGVLLYVVSAAFVKALLFLTAGRMRAVYGTNEARALSGVIRVLPFSGILFTVGTFALLGFPPFGTFMAEMLILSGIVQSGNLVAFTLMCTMLTIIFVATGRALFPMLWGTPERPKHPVRERWVTTLPKLGFVAALVLLGVYTPAPVSALLTEVATSIAGR